MARALATRRNWGYVKESIEGTTPGSPTMQYFPADEWPIRETRGSHVSSVLRNDRQVDNVRHGVKGVQGSISAYLYYLDQKDWFRAALGYDPAGGRLIESIDAASISLTWASADSSLTRGTGDWTAVNAEVGMMVRVTSGGLNAGIFTIASVSTTKLTFEEAVVDDSLITGTHVFEADYAEQGNVVTSFTLEEAYEDIAQFFRHTGIQPVGFSITEDPEGFAKVSFDVMGWDTSTNGTTLGAATRVSDDKPMPSFDGTLKVGGTAQTDISAFSVQVVGNHSPAIPLGSDVPVGIDPGQIVLTGSITRYFEDLTAYNLFRNETESSFQRQFLDADGNAIDIKLPALKFTGADRNVGDNIILMEMPFHVYRHAPTGNSIQLNMIPATAAV